MSEEVVEIDLDLQELALEWAACRMAVALRGLTEEEELDFVRHAWPLLFGLEGAA
jgi:hypothetical protein